MVTPNVPGPVVSRATTEIRSYLSMHGIRVALTSDPTPAIRVHTDPVDGTVVTVWGGASDRTVWGDPAANHRFRAFHDLAHWRHGFGFDADGERLAAEDHVRTMVERGLPAVGLLLWIESEAQQEFFRQAGSFPSDQEAFADLAWHAMATLGMDAREAVRWILLDPVRSRPGSRSP